jgi:hypothetical protein
MKKILFTSCMATLCSLLVSLHSVCAQGTAFTYQGRLVDGGQPANGTNYNLAFLLFDMPTNGTQLASFGVVGPTVSNGLFTVSLDFGDVFDGNQRWLEISVQKDGGGFTTLSPRQGIFPEPYSMFARNASNLLGALPAGQLSGTLSNTNLPSSPVFAGTVTANVFSGNGGGLTNLNALKLAGVVSSNQLPANLAWIDVNQTFSGTNTFSRPVVLAATNPILSLRGPGGAGAHATVDLSSYDPGTNAPSARLQTSDNNWGNDWDFYGKQTGANTNPLVSLLHLSANGNVGVGTISPQSKLEVAGGILARGGPPGPSGQSNNGYAFNGIGDNDSGMFSSGSGEIEFYNNSVESMRIVNGNVGIGTTNPTAPLQVVGNIMMGNGGNNFAINSAENLRIVRGTITPADSIDSGTGFTVTSNNVGDITINFVPAFAGIPTILINSSFHTYWLSKNASSSHIVTSTFNNGTPVNDYIEFIAIGP